MLLSNGLHHSENLPVKFDFSPKSTSTNIAKKLPLQRCFKPLLIALFQLLTQTPHVRFRGRKRVTHSAFGERSHTTAYTPKQGAFLPRPQRGLVLPAESFLFHRAFIYIHFPVLCEPSTPAEEKNPAKLPPQRCSKPLLIALFNFSHKRPTFAFMGESGYTLGFRRKIAHKGLHGETGAFPSANTERLLLPARSLQAE